MFPDPLSPESSLPFRQAWVAAEAGTGQLVGCASHNNYVRWNVQCTEVITVYNWSIAISQVESEVNELLPAELAVSVSISLLALAIF